MSERVRCLQRMFAATLLQLIERHVGFLNDIH